MTLGGSDACDVDLPEEQPVHDFISSLCDPRPSAFSSRPLRLGRVLSNSRIPSILLFSAILVKGRHL
jgi:hypothetical protein